VTGDSQFVVVLQIVSLVITILGTVVAFGMLIQQIKTLADELKEVRKKLDDHILDRNIHPDSEEVNRELRDQRVNISKLAQAVLRRNQ
jgi:predicted PurR-regulated permease PerM